MKRPVFIGVFNSCSQNINILHNIDNNLPGDSSRDHFMSQLEVTCPTNLSKRFTFSLTIPKRSRKLAELPGINLLSFKPSSCQNSFETSQPLAIFHHFGGWKTSQPGVFLSCEPGRRAGQRSGGCWVWGDWTGFWGMEASDTKKTTRQRQGVLTVPWDISLVLFGLFPF